MESLLLQFVGSLIAIVAVVLLAHGLGFSRSARLTSTDEAKTLFRLAPGGFEPVAIALDQAGKAAIARDASSRMAILLPHGAQFVAQHVEKRDRLTAKGELLRIEFAQAADKTVSLDLGSSAQDWAVNAPTAS